MLEGRAKINSLLEPMENEVVQRITKWRDDVVNRAGQAPENEMLQFLLDKTNAVVNAKLKDVKSYRTSKFVDATKSDCNEQTPGEYIVVLGCLQRDITATTISWYNDLCTVITNIKIISQQLEML